MNTTEAGFRARYFRTRYGSEVTNALACQAAHMREAAAAARKSAEREETDRPAPEPGYVDITPSPEGFRQLAALFTEAAGQAEAALHAWEELGEELDS